MKITLIELEHLVSLGHIPKINTITGYEDITDTYRKVEFGLHIKFNDGSELKCATNHLMLHNTEWIIAESCYIGMVFSDKTIVDILKLPKQEWVDFTVNAYHHSYIHNDITHHNSGKSHVIYLLIRFLLQYLERDILICVPTTALCSQIIDDFDDYVADDWIAYDNCHKIYSGQDKTSNKRVVVSTYQSLVKMSAAYFNKFDALIVDECLHPDTPILLASGEYKSIKNIQIGDDVTTFNEESKVFETKPVKKVHKNLPISSSEFVYRLTMENGKEIVVTGNHKIMTINGWKMVKDLTLDDTIIGVSDNV